MGNLPASTVSLLSKAVLTSESAVSSPVWAQNQELQQKYSLYEGNRTFQRAVFDYVNGDKKEAFKSLGHVLHLVEDMAVPAHTRQDTHADIAGSNDPGEPYEKWVGQNTNLSHLSDLNFQQEKLDCADLNDCFLKVARYSNENFFSEDTILDKNYRLSFRLEYKKEGKYYFAFNENNKKQIIYRFEKNQKGDFINNTLQDSLILSSYWQLLSREAVLGGVEVLKLFFAQVAQAEKDKNLLELPPEPKTAINLMTGLFVLPSKAAILSPFGEIVKLKNFAAGLWQNTGGKLISLFSAIGEPAGQLNESALNELAPSPEIRGEAPKPEKISTPSAAPKPAPAKMILPQEKTILAQEEIIAPSEIKEELLAPEDPSLIVEEKNPKQAILPSPLPESPATSTLPSGAGVGGSNIYEEDNSDNSSMPETSIISHPLNPAASTTAVFIFESSKVDSTFECQLDAATSTICVSPKEYFNLAEGSHVFKVKAKDAIGLEDSTPAEFSWTIDLGAPQISNISNTSGRTSVVISWDISETAISQIEYGLTTNYGLTSATTSLASLTLGQLSPNTAYHFKILAQDTVGNIASTTDQIFSTSAQAENVVISEIQISGANATDEFIELYNPTGTVIDLTGWKLAKRTAVATSSYSTNLLTSFPKKSILAHSYFLIAHPKDYDGGVPADAVYSSDSYSVASDNAVILYSDNGQTIVDLVGFGSAASFESSAVANPGNHQSVERKVDAGSDASLLFEGNDKWQGNGYDSNNNSQDFVLQNTAAPQNSLMLTEPRTDLPNLMTASAWPTWQKNFNRNGQTPSISLASTTLAFKWTATTTVTHEFNSRPALDEEGNIYIARADGLAKYSSLGNFSWLFATSTAASVPLISSDGTIFFRGDWGFYALNKSGQLKWKYSLSGSAGQYAVPAFLSDGTLITQSDEKIYAINQDATLKWIFDPGRVLQSAGGISSFVVDSADNVYISIDDYIYAISGSGALLWEKSFGYASSLAFSDGVLYFSVCKIWPDGAMKAVRASDGFEIWTNSLGYNFNNRADLAPAIDPSGHVFSLMFYGGGIKKLEAYNATSTPIWVNDRIDSPWLSSPIITSDGKIYVADQRALKIFDATDGDLIFTFNSPDNEDLYTFFGAVGSGGEIYTANPTKLYAIGD